MSFYHAGGNKRRFPNSLAGFKRSLRGVGKKGERERREGRKGRKGAGETLPRPEINFWLRPCCFIIPPCVSLSPHVTSSQFIILIGTIWSMSWCRQFSSWLHPLHALHFIAKTLNTFLILQILLCVLKYFVVNNKWRLRCFGIKFWSMFRAEILALWIPPCGVLLKHAVSKPNGQLLNLETSWSK